MTEDRRKKPFSYAEDQMIRQLAATGHSPREIVEEMAKAGYRRNRHTVHGYMQENDIVTDAKAYEARKGAPLRTGESFKIDNRAHFYIDPWEANERFRIAWDAFHYGRLYEDHPRAAPCVSTRHVPGPTAASYMTLGGVAVYG